MPFLDGFSWYDGMSFPRVSDSYRMKHNPLKIAIKSRICWGNFIVNYTMLPKVKHLINYTRLFSKYPIIDLVTFDNRNENHKAVADSQLIYM